MNFHEAYQFIDGHFTPLVQKIAGVKAIEASEGVIEPDSGRKGIRIQVLVDEEHFASSSKDIFEAFISTVHGDASPISPFDSRLAFEIWRRGDPIEFSVILLER